MQHFQLGHTYTVKQRQWSLQVPWAYNAVCKDCGRESGWVNNSEAAIRYLQEQSV